MKKNFGLFMLACAAFVFASCGGKKAAPATEEAVEETVEVATEVAPDAEAAVDEAPTYNAEELKEFVTNAATHIAEYKEAVGKYVEIAKKIVAGDKSLVNDAAAALVSANSIGDKLEAVKEQLTPEQSTEVSTLKSSLADNLAKVQDIIGKVEDAKNTVETVKNAADAVKNVVK